MSLIATLTEDFTGGAVDAAVTDANTVFDAATGTGAATFVVDPLDSTRRMMRVTNAVAGTASNVIRTVNAPATLPPGATFWLRFDLDIVAPLDTNTALVNVSGPADLKIADLRQVAGTRQIQLRNNNSEAAVSPAFPAGRMRIYLGVRASTVAAERWIRFIVHHEADDPNLLVQSYDSGQQASSISAATVDGFRMGSISNAVGDLRFGRMRADNAVPPYPAATTAPPSNTAAPTVVGIDGTPQVGETLTSTLGTWTGTPAPTLTRQWRKDGAAISGQTDPTYTPTSAGSYRCDVTGTNTDPGSPVTAQSNAVTVAAAPVVALAGAAATQAATATIKASDPTNGTAPYSHAIAQLSGPATTARPVGSTGRWWAVERQASATTWRVTTTDSASSTALVRDVTVEPAGSGGSTAYLGTSTGWVAV